MKIYIWYSFCQLFKNKLITIITTGMLAIGLILTCYAQITYVSYHQSELIAKRNICYDLEEVYNIRFPKYIWRGHDEIEGLNQLYDYIRGLPEVECCGLYYYDQMGEKRLYISPELAKLCEIDLDRGGNEYCAWVGKNLKDQYPKGTVLNEPNTHCKFTVEGVIEEGSTFPDDDFARPPSGEVLLDDCIIFDIDKMIETDNAYITNAIINNFYFCVPNKNDAESVKQSIRDKAASLNIDVYGINNLKTIFAANAREAMEKAGEKYLMPFFALLCSVIGMMAATMISYRLNKHDMDVMLLNGYTRRNVVGIFLFENIYKMLAAYIFTVLYWCKSKVALEYADDVDILPLFAALGILSFFMIWICTLPILIKLKRKTPIELTGET